MMKKLLFFYKALYPVIGKAKAKVVPVLFLTDHHALKVYWGSGGISPRIHKLGTILRLVVSFTSQLLYPQRKASWYPLDRRLCGVKS
jgi:hypothetical protein